MFEALRAAGFNIATLHHGEAILKHDMPSAAEEIERILLGFRIPIAELVSGGGGEAQGTQRLRRAFNDLGWVKKRIDVKKIINCREVASLSHEIDHVKDFGPAEWLFALEIEWNNKDPFFDRDLENFKRLHAEGAISVGAIITRGQSFQSNIKALLRSFTDRHSIDDLEKLREFGYRPTDRQAKMVRDRAGRTGDFRQAWVDIFVSDKFGEATTHWRKLEDRMRRGVGNPCPLILIGIPDTVIDD